MDNDIYIPLREERQQKAAAILLSVVGKVAQAVPSLRWVAEVYCYHGNPDVTTKPRVEAKPLPFVPGACPAVANLSNSTRSRDEMKVLCLRWWLVVPWYSSRTGLVRLTLVLPITLLRVAEAAPSWALCLFILLHMLSSFIYLALSLTLPSYSCSRPSQRSGKTLLNPAEA